MTQQQLDQFFSERLDEDLEGEPLEQKLKSGSLERLQKHLARKTDESESSEPPPPTSGSASVQVTDEDWENLRENW